MKLMLVKAAGWSVWIMAAWLVAAAPVAADPLRIATEGAYPPFNNVTDSGEVVGFDVDIANALCRAMERDCVIVTEPWATIIDGLLEQRFDAIIASMSDTPERRQRVAFTNRYYSTPMRLAGREDAGLTDDAAGLTGRRIGAATQTTAIEYLRREFAGIATIVEYPSQDDANQALRDGEIDATIADGLVLWQFLRSPEGEGFGFFGDPININSDIAIALRPQDTALLQDFNRAIALIIADGTHEEINARYFPFSIY